MTIDLCSNNAYETISHFIVYSSERVSLPIDSVSLQAFWHLSWLHSLQTVIPIAKSRWT